MGRVKKLIEKEKGMIKQRLISYGSGVDIVFCGTATA